MSIHHKKITTIIFILLIVLFPLRCSNISNNNPTVFIKWSSAIPCFCDTVLMHSFHMTNLYLPCLTLVLESLPHCLACRSISFTLVSKLNHITLLKWQDRYWAFVDNLLGQSNPRPLKCFCAPRHQLPAKSVIVTKLNLRQKFVNRVNLT